MYAVHTGFVAPWDEGTHFEWDDDKAEANVVHHRVTFLEAITVFTDPLSVICDDDEHSTGERRQLTIGRSSQDRVLIVSYTERGDSVRIISAREAEPRERKAYEEVED
jgi:uncharacterized DUF497 family protein